MISSPSSDKVHSCFVPLIEMRDRVMGSSRRIVGTLGLLSCLTLSANVPMAGAAAPVGKEAPRVPFTQRYQAVQHGGLVRASNSSIGCRKEESAQAEPCAAVNKGAAGTNSDYEMFYDEVDKDPDTYNSTRAELKVPQGAKVSYARLYWGGNLRVGEQKPPEDNGRVLVAEPGGAYKEVLADTVIGHRSDNAGDAYQASADVTPLVRKGGAGMWTVAQLNIAMGHSDMGAWGGWTLVVAYEHPQEPVRRVSIWDGFEGLAAGAGEAAGETVRLTGLDAAPGASGRAGVVAYDGDRGTLGDSLTVTADSGRRISLSDGENPFNDVMNSTITEFGRPSFVRQPEHVNNLGYDADVFDLSPALSGGARSLTFGFTGESQGHFLGVLFVQTDARR
ncbi:MULTISPECIES: DUF3344 domain-containing protein [unclassified Streptomyces]|uniref:DUF3344 domain-containing protein n=1 Tax=unclassified Streptomyces TaxID=2593676 RepID=UPI000DC7A9A7|nr:MULTISPECIES: DUF3344 domain-containing protein [unclassified Streptomyces]AWZ09634.1 DUF3344 domain-containing protein [Streptomyces sp. ICC4]AWZ15863.1 DUF3344 domain-containing protein [Streptomyces sp. ICC1]